MPVSVSFRSTKTVPEGPIPFAIIWPLILGVPVDAGPDDTTRFTADPVATEVPDVGF